MAAAQPGPTTDAAAEVSVSTGTLGRRRGREADVPPESSPTDAAARERQSAGGEYTLCCRVSVVFSVYLCVLMGEGVEW